MHDDKFFLGFIIVGLILLVAQINMSYCSFLGKPSNQKLRSECNFRRLWGGGGGKGLKPKLLLGFTK